MNEYPGCNGHRIKARCALAGGPHPGKAPARQLDRLTDPCPKLGGFGADLGVHVVRQVAQGHGKPRCIYCSRRIDLTPAAAPAPAAGQLELELPEARSCATCGGSLEGKRPQATTCSSRCRQAAARRRQPAPVREVKLCRYCRRELTSSRASTCSSRCRSAMFRQRSSAVLASDRTHLDAGQLYRLRLAKGPDAPEAMRVRGASFWACRCGLIVRDTDATCGFCGGARPQRYLVEALEDAGYLEALA